MYKRSFNSGLLVPFAILLQKVSLYGATHFFCVCVVSRYNSTGGNYVVTRDMYRSENNSKWRINGKNATMKEVHFSVYSLQSRVICKRCFMFREVQDLYLQLFTWFCQQVESSSWMLLVYM